MEYLLANGQTLTIRPALVEDAAALMEMFRRAVTETDFLLTTPYEARQLTLEQEKEFIARYQQNPYQLFLLAEVEGKLAGSLSITQSKWKKQRHIGEFGIVILRRYWNLGIGRRMINHMLQWAEQHPVLQCIYLSVLAGNEKAIRMYRNFGFSEAGRMEKAILQTDNSFHDLLLMSKWITKN